MALRVPKAAFPTEVRAIGPESQGTLTHLCASVAHESASCRLSHP